MGPLGGHNLKIQQHVQSATVCVYSAGYGLPGCAASCSDEAVHDEAAQGRRWPQP